MQPIYKQLSLDRVWICNFWKAINNQMFITPNKLKSESFMVAGG